MAIAISTKSKNFAPVSEGVHNLMLAKVLDIGIVEDKLYGPKHKVVFVYIVDEADEEGQPKLIVKSFNATLGRKAGLRKELKGLTRKDPPFDIPDLTAFEGTQGVVVIEHSEGTDSTGAKRIYGNISAFMGANGKSVLIPADWKLPEGLAKMAVKPGTPQNPTANSPITDEDIPFS